MQGNEPMEKRGIDVAALRESIIAILQTMYDPEIPVNIYELGMVYDIQIDAEFNTVITMTLTSPMCPVVETLPAEVQDRVAALEGLKTARVDLVWEPAWTPDRMSEAAKLQLGMM